MKRVSASIDVELETVEGALLRGRLADVSVVGVRFSCAETVAPGSACRVRLFVGGAASEVEARGVVVRAEGGSLAVRFEHLPHESYERLRSFLLAHSDDATAFDAELSERMGFLAEGA